MTHPYETRWTTSLDELEVRMIATPRGPVEVAHAGQGPAVLMVHGTPGSWRQIVPLAEDLASDFKVVLVSRPGYGSTPLSTTRSATEQADAFASVLEQLDIDRTSIIGVSGGGPSAAAFAQHHPSRTSSLVLACALSAHLLNVPNQMRLLLAIPFLSEVTSLFNRRLGRARLKDPKAVDRTIRENLTEDERRRLDEDPQIAADLVRFALSHLDAPPGIAGFRNDIAEINRIYRDGKPEFIGAACPTLILHGDSDETVSLDHPRFYASAVPQAELIVYEKAGHLFLFTRREESTPLIAKFLANHSG
jgi:pimeloyl-ACP methyl ester carboxylesterase